MRSAILAFVFGVWLLQQQPALPPLAWAGILAVPGGLLLLPRGRFGRFEPWFAWGAWLALALGSGYFFAAAAAHARLADALPVAWEGKDIRMVGVVATLPQASEFGGRFEFDVERVLTPDAVVPRHLLLSWYGKRFQNDRPASRPDFHPGERWELTVRLKRPHGNANPYGFDYEGWLLERNIRATGSIRLTHGERRLEQLVPHPGYVVERVREIVAARMQTVLGERPYAGVLEALAIGEQGAISQEQWQVFLRTGVNHLMSISGLHVTMVAGLAYSLAGWLWRRREALARRLPAQKAAVAGGALAALAYALLAGFAVPTQRTLYMLSVVAVALWLGRSTVPSRVLALALLLVVLLDPWAVLAPGFWLSFGAVGVILYVSAGRVGRSGRWAEAVNVQWAVTIGLIPALLAMFQQISLISPVANAFAIPVVSLAVVPLTLAGALLPLDFLLYAAHWVMGMCMAALAYLSALPDAVWQQHAPPPWALVAAMPALGWLLLPRGFPARWLGVVAAAPLFAVAPLLPAPGALWVDILDVGQGLAVVLRTRSHALLYDTGPRFSKEADSGNRVILPYLRATGIPRLDGVIVTHDDADHSGGAITVLNGIPVGWLASSLPAGSPILSHAARAVPCYGGQSWVWDGVRFDMLHPALASYQDRTLKDNARSCVLKVSAAHGSVLLPADIERASEGELVDRDPSALAATVLVAPHHGSKTSSTEAFLEAVHPAATVFTVGYLNRFGHPKPAVVERYRQLGSELYRSDRDGAVLLRPAPGGGFAIQAYRTHAHRYWWH